MDETRHHLLKNGDLDERKWELLKKNRNQLQNILYLVYGLTAGLISWSLYTKHYTDTVLFSVLGYYFAFILLIPRLKEFDVYTYLYDFGIEHKAEIEYILPYMRPGYSYVKVKCKWKLDGKEYVDTIEVPSRYVPDDQFHRKEEIKIIYDKHNPSLFRYTNRWLREKFDLRNRLIMDNHE